MASYPGTTSRHGILRPIELKCHWKWVCFQYFYFFQAPFTTREDLVGRHDDTFWLSAILVFHVSNFSFQSLAARVVCLGFSIDQSNNRKTYSQFWLWPGLITLTVSHPLRWLDKYYYTRCCLSCLSRKQVNSGNKRHIPLLEVLLLTLINV